ncbi:hypothetical protein VTO73DRAFT_9626 [Trametes versicolor]
MRGSPLHSKVAAFGSVFLLVTIVLRRLLKLDTASKGPRSMLTPHNHSRRSFHARLSTTDSFPLYLGRVLQ